MSGTQTCMKLKKNVSTVEKHRASFHKCPLCFQKSQTFPSLMGAWPWEPQLVPEGCVMCFLPARCEGAQKSSGKELLSWRMLLTVKYTIKELFQAKTLPARLPSHLSHNITQRYPSFSGGAPYKWGHCLHRQCRLDKINPGYFKSYGIWIGNPRMDSASYKCEKGHLQHWWVKSIRKHYLLSERFFAGLSNLSWNCFRE